MILFLTSQGELMHSWMDVPSGNRYEHKDLEIVSRMGEYGFIQWREPVTLKSGIITRAYIVGREALTDHPDLEWLVGEKIAEITWERLHSEERPKCLIGIPVAGTPLAQAAAMYAHQVPPNDPRSISHRIMREVKKEQYGMHHGWVDGTPNPARFCYGAIDNTATDGGSKIRAGERFAEDGYPVDEMFWVIFVDRGLGALENLVRQGFPYAFAIYTLLDIVYALCELNIWHKGRFKMVEAEVKPAGS